jgi:hypothetical protein
MNDETNKQIEFVKLPTGGKFLLSIPEIPPTQRGVYTKIVSQKDARGVWQNAKDMYGLTTFIQYDRRVWVNS